MQRITRLTIELTLPNAQPLFLELLEYLVHGMPSHVRETLTPRRKDMCKLARVRHRRGHGAVWLGCRGEPGARSGSSCGRLSVTQGEDGSAISTTHTTVSEITR